MKQILIVLAATVVSASGQAVFVPSSPAISPGTPAATPSPVFVPGSSALAADLTGALTNTTAIGTNLTLPGLSGTLQNVQVAIEEALPAVAAFNNSFMFTNAPGAGTMAANFSANLGNNFSANLGSNFGVNFGTPVAPNIFFNGPNSTPGSVGATLRAMLVLQSDMEQLLPLLDGLNGGTNAAAAAMFPGFAPGNLTNLFQQLPASQ